MYHLRKALLAGTALAMMLVQPVCAKEELEPGNLVCIAPCATHDLFVRAEANEQAEVVSVLTEGMEVEILSGSYEGWYKISACGITGYVSRDYVVPSIVKTIEESDIYLLAQAISAEAEGAGMQEKILVGKVILNRIDSDYRTFATKTSITEVLSTPNAYPVTWDRIQGGLVPSEESLKVARQLLDGTMEDIYYDDILINTDVLYQTSDDPSDWATVLFKTEYHYYAIPK